MNARERHELADRQAQQLLFARRPPARTSAFGAGIVLGMTEVEVGLLVAKSLLKPLGKPTQKAAKWFATSELFHLADDRDWLSKATQVIQGEWRERNNSRKASKGDDGCSPVNQGLQM